MANMTEMHYCPPAVDISSLNLSGYEYHDGWTTDGNGNGNGSNGDTDQSRSPLETVIKCAAYAVVFVVAVVGNAAVTLVVTDGTNPHMRSTTNFYLVNLAVADLTISLFCMWTHLIKHLAYPHFILGPIVCQVDAFIHMTALTSSVLTLTAISCNRFFAVMFPLRARFAKQRTNVLIIGLIWTSAIVSSMPFLFHREYTEIRWKNYVQPQCGDVWPAVTRYDPRKGACEVFYPTKRLYYTFFSLALFFVPVTVMSIMYLLLIWRLWISPLPGEQSNAAILVQSRAKRKVIKMVATVLIAFVVCWMPLQVLNLYGVYGHEAHEHGRLPDWFSTVEYLAYFIAYSNSAINPIIYCGFNENFRRGLTSLVSCSYFRDMKNSIHSNRSPATNLAGIRNSNRLSKRNKDTEMAEMVVIVRRLAEVSSGGNGNSNGNGNAASDITTKLIYGRHNKGRDTRNTPPNGELTTDLSAFNSMEHIERH